MWRCRSRPRCCSAPLFAGDSVWTALAALLVAGGWGALALAGRAPLPGGGGVLARAAARDCGLERALDRLVGRARSLLGRAEPDARVRRVPRRRPPARRRPAGACEARRRRADRGARRRRASGRSRARRSRRSSPTAAAPPGCATRSATGTRSRSPPTRCSCSRSRSPPRRERSRCGWAARCLRTRPSSPSFWRPRAPESRPPCSAPCSGSGSAAIASRRRCLRSSRSCRRPQSRPGRSPGRRSSTTAPRTPTASPTAPGSGCSSSSAARSSRSAPARSRDVRWLPHGAAAWRGSCAASRSPSRS